MSSGIVHNPGGEGKHLGNDESMAHLLIGRYHMGKWPGVTAVYFPHFGHGLMALQYFKKNDVIVDYHGLIVRETWEQYKTGNIMHEYCLEVKGANNRIIDASRAHCGYHQLYPCLGRLINHAAPTHKMKNRIHGPCNLILVDCKYPKESKDDYVIFKARKDIKPFEQLRFDYNDPTAHELFD